MRWIAVAFLVWTLAACSSGNGTTDTGPGEKPDMVTPWQDAGPQDALPDKDADSAEQPQDGQTGNDAPCVPDCADRQCGDDDGCGGLCTGCPENQECTNVEEAPQEKDYSCVWSCDYVCAEVAECGDVVVYSPVIACHCGECPVGYTCDEQSGEMGANQCLCQGTPCGELCCGAEEACFEDACCVPDCEAKECGDDGCGGSCGDCNDGFECQDGQCACIPDCSGKECGDDGCEGSCGTCPEGDTCLDDGTCCTPDCEGKDCGLDGCGGICGQCTGTGLCQDGVCCYPDCTGMVCGDDGCGGDCGLCGPTEFCEAGHCYPDPQYIGCSDGSREGFLDSEKYPLIAACGGAWDVPGIHNVTPACNRESGNTGTNPEGTGCNVTDLCAEGWHVCLGRSDVDYRSPLGCLEIMDGAPSPAFFLVRTSSTGAMNCAPDTIGEPTSINDLFGCGDLGCPANEASCEPLQVASHDLCKSIKNKPTSSCTCHFLGELDPGDPKYEAGNFEDVLCTPNSGGCGWCKPLDYYNKKYGVTHPDAWNCGTNTTQEAINVTKSYPDQQGGVLCCKDQCETDADCEEGQVCIMSTCQ